MPRPKRTKITSATTRVSKHAPRTEVAKPAATKLSKAKQNAKTFSDDSDGLVVKSKTTRSTRGQPLGKTHEPVVEADLEMTGALPVAEGSPAETPKDRTPASKASKRTRGTRLSGRQILSSTAKSASTRSPVEVAQEEAAQEGDTSGFGDLTFSSFGSESPLHGTRPPSAMKVGATPAHEASILALTNFKRRARQPSLLRMVQQTTDVEDNDQSGLDDTDNFDFDDFLPHAESTPLNVRKPVAEDDARNDSGTQISSSGSRGVKRKLTPVVQVPRSSPPCDPPSGAYVESSRPPSPSLPEIQPTREEIVAQTQDEPEPLSDTYASPMSSSPVREVATPPQSPVQPRTRGRGRPSKKAPTYAESEGEETEAPKKAKRTAKSKAQQKISTAQLKVLLPRRRNRNLRDRDEFDIDSSEATPIDSEQDELQMPNPRARQRGSAKVASPKAAKKNARGTKATASRQSKTYSRRISSDKENDARNDGDEEPTEASVAEHSEKLLAIKKKFEEVDAFELDFETGDVTTSSSPFR
ncbi:hypothetical protein HBH56_075540 [Parastagonospora nodorum]|uniref:Uncharacterized protein n=1 Tax=Phaeosphaeria nodorum (strain SN15 / ATCC MYA-4574 / FGSC 10173) TaxID=321614 RepID=A0A7U2NQL8_PHANO|nr:hypothetical protein HBH56_075540 [Parastagonospora nodorum]QRD06824.1 hypothetical protein JI435_127630 [Parastagonospora nodorum SN15]KAH3927479.1 hypothetical protein HBH54_155780 [Parastagonospora nodorum]KAH4139350.1 hypothetical protein HBH45_099210 [Parastagonospora nodorum]KAH4166540.1 hypothetical protein HBH44_060370 [Parastagonospora nodorum]